MKIDIRVIPGAKAEQIQLSIDGNIKVWIKEKAIEGKANRALIKLLSKYFKVPASSVSIISGLKSRNKIVEITENM